MKLESIGSTELVVGFTIAYVRRGAARSVDAGAEEAEVIRAFEPRFR
jgi:hypothetical protein